MTINFVPITDFTDKDWYEAYLVVYDKNLAYSMGVDPKLIVNAPSLTEFYDNIMSSVNKGTAHGWGIKRGDDYLGHTILDKSSGVWEFGTVLKKEGERNKGIGARATFHAVKWIFEDQNEEWAIAFTRGKDPRVKEILLKAGFRPLMNFLIMDKRTWNERWAGRV